MSAQTRKTKINHPVKKAGRGLGYFGDDSDKLKDMEKVK